MKKAFVTQAIVDTICKDNTTPFYIYDEHGIKETTRTLQDAFKWNPGFQEFYAIKACPNPHIVKIMTDLGCGVDCSSLAELKIAESLGLSGEKIMFSSNNTPASEYLYAQRLGATINLDDISHIEMLDSAFETYPECMSLRYNPGGVFTIGAARGGHQVMDTPDEAKFGMTKAQVFEGIQALKQRGVKRFGLHSFVASNTLSNDYYPTLARMMFELALEIKKQLKIELEIINLSGGIGIPYQADDTPNDIFAIASGVKRAFNELMVPAGLDSCKIYTELGRYMTGPHGELICRVLHLKHTYKNYAGVDANACNLLRPAMYKAYHHITVLGKEDTPANTTYDVVGNLCENNDKLAINRKLPELAIGDTLVIHDSGAHAYAMGYNYNGRLRSAEFLLHEDGSIQKIRRAETLDDLFATLLP